MEFAGKVAIVIGASIGIGREYALALAEQGASVIAAARSVDALADVADAAEGLPGTVRAVRCDITEETDIEGMCAYAMAEFGRIDILVNNAGIYPHHETFSIDEATWRQSMDVNLHGPYLAIRHVVPAMIAQGSGSIVNITSGSAGYTFRGAHGHADLMLYCVSKAALNRLSTYMAEELKPHGIAVNALSPGAVDTDTWNRVDPQAVSDFKERGLVKPCTSAALGPAMLHLAGQGADGITGQILHTDEFGKSWP